MARTAAPRALGAARLRARAPVFALLAVVLLLGAACGSDEPSDSDSAENSESAPADDGAAAEDSGAAAPDDGPEADDDDDAQPGGEDAPEHDDSVALEGPEAPEFTLDLADGSEFVLSAEDRATFLVFWAEW